MELNEYQAEMQRTYKPDRLLNHVLGLAGEAGEVADLVKKREYHGVDFPAADMRDELGDCLWYLSALAADFGYTLEEVARANVEKLRRRYPSGFVHGGGVR